MKITLRDLFWLILVAAVGLGWFAHFRSWQDKIDRFQTTMHEREMEHINDKAAVCQTRDLWKQLAISEMARSRKHSR